MCGCVSSRLSRDTLGWKSDKNEGALHEQPPPLLGHPSFALVAQGLLPLIPLRLK